MGGDRNKHITTDGEKTHEGNRMDGVKENNRLGSNLDRMEMASKPSPRE